MRTTTCLKNISNMEMKELFGYLAPFFWLIPSPWFLIRKTHSRNRNKKYIDSLRLKLNEKSQSYLEDFGIAQISHGLPYYEIIETHRDNSSFFLPIPIEKKELLSKKKFTQQKIKPELNCLSDSFLKINDFNKGFSFWGCKWDEASKQEIRELSIKVADRIYNDITSGKRRFNGLMSGVFSFSETCGNDENVIPDILLYKTDFFTFRVFAQYYKDHYEKIKDVFSSNEITKIVNGLSMPFLSSLGVSIIAVISTNSIKDSITDDDLVVIGYRSDKVEGDNNSYHFTMNEAVIPADAMNNSTTFSNSATRGFVEELRWASDSEISFSQFYFTDLYLETNKCQVGLTGFVKIELTGQMSNDLDYAKKKLKGLYSNARDGSFETKEIVFIPVKEIRQFLSENKKTMSAGFAVALNNFIDRYELGVLTKE